MLQAGCPVSPSLLVLPRKAEGSGRQPQDTEGPQPPCLLRVTRTPLSSVCRNGSQAANGTIGETHDNLAAQKVQHKPPAGLGHLPG